ncbi:hypothetical protein L798_08788 [Zootermopsis nevadensis]|uniref:Uncharacterized protein n=1 Tax=Zootermopsis nevadensis TaxID=136037 RepID=A0A067R109_ZOONE|nr:hypothetical protein L798_08788 [Zootermopsis nevadensis]
MRRANSLLNRKDCNASAGGIEVFVPEVESTQLHDNYYLLACYLPPTPSRSSSDEVLPHNYSSGYGITITDGQALWAVVPCRLRAEQHLDAVLRDQRPEWPLN